MERVVRLGATFCACALGSLPNLRRRERFATEVTSRIFPLTYGTSMFTASPLQICCGGCGYPPGRTLVRFALTLRTGLADLSHTYLLTISALMPCSCPLQVSPLSQALS